MEQDLLIKTDGAGTIRFKLHVDDGAGWSNSRTLHEELCSVMQEVWPNSKWDGDKDDPMSFSISRERVQPMAGSISMLSMESTQDESTWDYDDYISVEPRFEALLESCDETELIPALSVADIDTCEEAVKYSPDEMHTQLIESSNTAVHVSILKVIIDSAKELIRLERFKACNPVVRMAAPAQQEGQAIESQIAGNTQTTTVAGIQTTTVAGRVRIEPKFEALLEGCDEAYLITALSMANIETCEEAVEYSPEEMHERLLRSSDTAVQVSTLKMIIDNTKEMLRLERIGAWNPFVRSVEPSTYSGTETESYSEQHVSAEEREARHKSTVSRTRMNVSGKHVTISQGTSTMSVITSPDSNTAESTYHLLVSPAFDVPNGDFDGPLQGRFKLVKRDLDQQHQQQLEQNGWVVTSAGTGVQGSAEAQSMRMAATEHDTKNVVFIPKEWGETSDGGEPLDSEMVASEAAQVSNPVSVSASLVQELEAPEWCYYGNMHNEAKVSHDLPLTLSAHTAIELWHPGASAPKNPTMIYLCGGLKNAQVM